MTVKFRIPVEQAEEPTAGLGDDLFPEGTWKARIEKVRTQEVRRGEPADWMLQQDGEYFADYAEVASIQLGGFEPLLEDQEDPGNRKFFDDRFYLQFDDVRWDEASEAEMERYPRFGRTRRRLTNLAMAVGASENTGGGVGPVSEFDEILTATDSEDGEGLAGVEVFVTTEQYDYDFTGRDGEQVTGTKDRVVRYQQAV